MSAFGRLKLAAIDAVRQAGGKEGAAATAQRSPSTAADWRNINSPALPPLDCAWRLDAAAVAEGREPALLAAMAQELGFALFPLPDPVEPVGSATLQLVAANGQMGRVAETLVQARADGRISPREADLIVAETDKTQAHLVRLRRTLTGESEG